MAGQPDGLRRGRRTRSSGRIPARLLVTSLRSFRCLLQLGAARAHSIEIDGVHPDRRDHDNANADSGDLSRRFRPASSTEPESEERRSHEVAESELEWAEPKQHEIPSNPMPNNERAHTENRRAFDLDWPIGSPLPLGRTEARLASSAELEQFSESIRLHLSASTSPTPRAPSPQRLPRWGFGKTRRRPSRVRTERNTARQ